MKKSSAAAAVVVIAVLVGAFANAHVGAATPVGFANTSQEVSFSVGHGVGGADTSSVRIQIPNGVSSVRPFFSDFAKPSIETDATGQTTAVSWQRPDADLLDKDYGYYKLTVRVRLPDAPFTTVYFPSRQVCKHLDGGTNTSEWSATTAAEIDAGVSPAPAIRVLPARRSGWNKYTVPVAVSDLSGYLGDAQIVWKGNAAYSANPATVEQIANTPGVNALTTISAGDEIWVKY